MELLHNDTNLFKKILTLTSNKLHIAEQIIEKDYYISIILRYLSEQLPFVVFKGGTSLSKCYQVINRFSEDIDITTDIPLTQGQKRKFKIIIVSIANDLNLTIENLEETHSRRDYNRYIITYNSVVENFVDNVKTSIILETAYTTTSFPISQMLVSNYIQQVLLDEAPELIKIYLLNAFTMKVQSIERTFIDKVFAICDYYLQNKTLRHSRHLYDIYKLTPRLSFDNNFQQLITEVRNERSKSPICISASNNIDINALLQEIIVSNSYKEDYNKLTIQLLGERIEYEEIIPTLRKIIDHKIF